MNESDDTLLASKVSQYETLINKHFAFNTVEEIIASLEADDSDFAKVTKETILSKSPVSLKVALEQAIRCEDKTLEEALQQDEVLAKNFLDHADFYEGIRSVLIDKDRTPNYQYRLLSDVDENLVNSFFEK